MRILTMWKILSKETYYTLQIMVRESRYIKVGQIPSGTTEEGVNEHFGK